MEVLVHHAEKIRQMYEAFSRGDIPSVLSNIHHDCIWEVMGQPEIPFAGIYHGVEDCGKFFKKLDDTIEFKEMVPEHILETGNTVITFGHMKGLIRKNDKLFSSIFSMIYELNDEGQILHFRDCLDTLTVARAINSK